MFYFLEDFHYASYADDPTRYNEDKSTRFIVKDLEQLSSIIFKWLNENHMRGNTDKNHFLVSSNLELPGTTIDSSQGDSIVTSLIV